MEDSAPTVCAQVPNNLFSLLYLGAVKLEASPLRAFLAGPDVPPVAALPALPAEAPTLMSAGGAVPPPAFGADGVESDLSQSQLKAAESLETLATSLAAAGKADEAAAMSARAERLRSAAGAAT